MNCLKRFPNPSIIHRNSRVTRVDDLIRVVTLHAAVVASGPLTYLLGCRIASYDSYQVCYLKHRMVLTEATGDAELVLRDESIKYWCRKYEISSDEPGMRILPH